MSRKVYGQFWKDIGKTDPYFGVLTHPEYRSDRLDEAALAAFFESGKQHIEQTIHLFQKVWPKRRFKPQNALDFGSGTGRLTLALAEHARRVTGVDISPAMVAEANLNRDRFGISNAQFKVIEGNSGFLDEVYDYIHSSIVLQHIHPNDGMEIIDHLLESLADKGRAYINVTYHTDVPAAVKWNSYLNISFPRVRRWLSRNADYAFPMFDYDLNAVFALMQKHHIKRVHTAFGQTGQHNFVQLYMQKNKFKT
ncbi:MAG: methyltransferase domain-containing protein [Bacteroidota bacterium]